MSFRSLASPLELKVDALTNEPGWLESELCVRLGHLALISITGSACLVDTTIGIIAYIFNIVTAGQIDALNAWANSYLASSAYIIADPCLHLIKTLNPDAKFKDEYKESISGNVRSILDEVIRDLVRNRDNNSDSWLMREVGSRFSYAMMGVAMVIVHFVTVILAPVSITTAFILLGTEPEANSQAYEACQCTALIHDLSYCLLKIVNPDAAFPEKEADIAIV